MVKMLIVPGLGGAPAPHWQHWLASTVPGALLVEQMDWHRPCPRQWEVELAGILLQHPGAVLVGHGLGASLIARVIASWPQIRAGGALLVAPRGLEIFVPPKLPLNVPAVLVASRNDPALPWLNARRLAEIWQADMLDLGHAGGIDSDSGYGPWPLARHLAQQLVTEGGGLRTLP